MFRNRSTLVLLVMLLSVLFSVPASAQKPSETSILIRNATIIDKEGEQDTIIVNILIKDSKLDIITEDLIPSHNAFTL